MRKSLFVSLVATLVTIAGCDNYAVQSYRAKQDVLIEYQVQKVKWRADDNKSFIYVDMSIINESESIAKINISNFSAQVNKIQSEHTFYASIGSVEATDEDLPVGRNSYSVYFVFAGDVRSPNGLDFEIVRVGISEKIAE
jgi:hypothetical protein